MNNLAKTLMICVGISTAPLLEAVDFQNPTEKFLEAHSMDDIKYNLRLENVTLIYKDQFDKAATYEREGIIGYHGDSLECRIYQDVIRITLEEVVGLSIPKDFHFLDIPCFEEERISALGEVPQFFQPEKNNGSKVQQQLFAVNMALYANHNQLGHSAVKNFTINTPTTDPELLNERLKMFFYKLGMDPLLVDEIFATGKSMLKDDRGILLQLFDNSEQPYDFANRNCYPAYPNGYPFANRKISEYHYEEASSSPAEIKMLLTSKETLNPNSPLMIKRYDKTQPSIVKNYESAVRDLIKNCEFDSSLVASYQDDLALAWEE